MLTKEKARMVLNQILNTAVEDGIIPRNPARSRRAKIAGKASAPTATPSQLQNPRFLVTRSPRKIKERNQAGLS